MLCWISKGIINLTRDEGCDGVITGVEYTGDNSSPMYFIQILAYENKVLAKKLMYLDQEQMQQDFTILKDCYVNLMVGSNSGNRVRLFNPPQDLTNTIAQEERDATRNTRRGTRNDNIYTPSGALDFDALTNAVRSVSVNPFVLPDNTGNYTISTSSWSGSPTPNVEYVATDPGYTGSSDST